HKVPISKEAGHFRPECTSCNALFIYIEDLQYKDLMKMDILASSEVSSARLEHLIKSVGCVLRCTKQNTNIFASPALNDIPLFGSTVQREKHSIHDRLLDHVITDSASCNKETTDTFASPALLNAIPDMLPDHVLNLTNKLNPAGLNAFFLQNSEEHYRSILRLVKEQTQSESEWNDASSKVKYISSRIDLLDVIIKAENFDFVTELKKLAAEHIDAE
ncbi:hypothetical protein IGI04_029887, partial [Brassica rapa subsp. trilocularis]